MPLLVVVNELISFYRRLVLLLAFSSRLAIETTTIATAVAITNEWTIAVGRRVWPLVPRLPDTSQSSSHSSIGERQPTMRYSSDYGSNCGCEYHPFSHCRDLHTQTNDERIAL